jgi:hypothetical protein
MVGVLAEARVDLEALSSTVEKELGGKIKWSVSPIVNSGNIHFIVSGTASKTKVSKKIDASKEDTKTLQKMVDEINRNLTRKIPSKYKKPQSKVQYSVIGISIELYRAF